VLHVNNAGVFAQSETIIYSVVTTAELQYDILLLLYVSVLTFILTEQENIPIECDVSYICDYVVSPLLFVTTSLQFC